MNDGTYICKQNEVLETGIEMGLLFKANNLLEMRVVDVGIDTKQALEYCLYYFLEVWREWCALTEGKRNPNQITCSIASDVRCSQETKRAPQFHNKKQHTKFLREYGFIIKLAFNPIHQILHIFWCGYLYGFLYLHTISPSVLIPA